MDQPQIRNSKVQFLHLVIVICFDSFPQLFQLMHVLGWFGLGMMRHKNIDSYFMQREGGSLYRIAKTSQQEYDAANPMRTLCANLAKSASKSSRAFHNSLSDGCTITWSFSHTSSLCHLICLAVFFERKNHFI
jgi:hypothetical protein